MAAACRSSRPMRAGGSPGAKLTPQPDDDVPRFDYEAHVRDLVEKRVWPSSTRRISELRIVIDYELALRPQARDRARPAQPRHRRLSRRVAARPRAPEEILCRVERRRLRHVARAAPHEACRRMARSGSPAPTRPGRRTRRRRARWPRSSRAICAPPAPTSTLCPCCRPAASSCRATWRARPR